MGSCANPMIVVIDTNQFHGDPRMALRDFRVLFAQHEHGSLELAVPEVVLQELPKMYRREYEAAHAKLNSGLKKLSKLGYDTYAEPQPPSGAEAQEQYAIWLHAHLTERRVRTPALPATNLAQLVEHSVAERRPWQANSKGFRDALIWHTVLELAAKDDVILITDNWRDFAESEQAKDVLHPDLRSDVAALGHDEDRVRIVPSLLLYIEQHVAPAERQLLEVRERLESDRHWRAELWDQASDVLWRLQLDTWDEGSVVRSNAAEIDNVSVDQVAIEDLQITNAYEADTDGTISLELQVRAVLHFTFTTDTGGMEWLAKENADVQFDIHEETFSQGSTLARYVTVTYAVDYSADAGELGELRRSEPSRTPPGCSSGLASCRCRPAGPRGIARDGSGGRAEQLAWLAAPFELIALVTAAEVEGGKALRAQPAHALTEQD
jgi:hypothetical protein